MLTRWTASWLTALADPLGARPPLPEHRLKPRALERLLRLAETHGVLPAVASNLRQVAQSAGAERIIRTSGGASAQENLSAALKGPQETLLERTALSLVVRRQSEELLDALRRRDVPAVVLKGTEFADRLYPIASFRPFIDADVLVPPAALSDVRAVMQQLDYLPKPTKMKYNSGYGEQSFWRKGRPGGAVEIHWNLVNSPTLRRGVSVEFEDLQFEGSQAGSSGRPRLSPASLLLIAAVHGATSHSFDQLRLLCDVCQAARGAAGEVDADWLSDAAKQTGASLALTAGLGLAGRIFREPKCDRMLQRLGLAGRDYAWRVLLSPGVVLRAQTRIDSLRRTLFRAMLKRRR